jgi:hypothetical protein
VVDATSKSLPAWNGGHLQSLLPARVNTDTASYFVLMVNAFTAEDAYLSTRGPEERAFQNQSIGGYTITTRQTAEGERCGSRWLFEPRSVIDLSGRPGDCRLDAVRRQNPALTGEASAPGIRRSPPPLDGWGFFANKAE